MDRLLRYEEVAHLLGLKYSTVRRLAADGVLPRVYPTPKRRAVRIPSGAVEAFLRKTEAGNAA
jgi:excisionase family DNA binding protein